MRHLFSVRRIQVLLQLTTDVTHYLLKLIRQYRVREGTVPVSMTLQCHVRQPDALLFAHLQLLHTHLRSEVEVARCCPHSPTHRHHTECQMELSAEVFQEGEHLRQQVILFEFGIFECTGYEQHHPVAGTYFRV